MGVDPAKTICWFVGTFGSTYDLEPVIECARRLERTHQRVQFVFSGGGDRFEEWSGMAAGLRNVVFTDGSTPAGWPTCQVSRRLGSRHTGPGAPQGLPNKIFEYLSAGLPIVASLGDECKALLEAEGCGSTYAAGDPASLMATLTPYLDDNEAYPDRSRRERGAFVPRTISRRSDLLPNGRLPRGDGGARYRFEASGPHRR